MPKYVTRMAKSGESESYEVKDSQARQEIAAEATAREAADATKVPNTRKVNGHALSSDVTVTKEDVGLGNVDNTSDANKPISTAQAEVNTQVSGIIGNTPLPTTNKTLTGAINEHENDIAIIEGEIGDTPLPTTDKTLSGAISEIDVNIAAEASAREAAVQSLDVKKVNKNGYKEVTPVNSQFFSQQNYYDETTLVRNKWIQPTSGQEETFVGWSSTDYIPIYNHTSLSCLVGNNNGIYGELGGIYGAFYDSSKTYISGFLNETLASQTIPANAAYVRISQETRKFVAESGQIVPFTMVIASSEWGSLPTYIAEYVRYGFKLTEGIDQIEDAMLYNGIRGVPLYTETEIDTVVQKVRNLQGGNTISFAFLTDLHNASNKNIRASNHHAIQSVQSIEKKIPLDYVVFGGDYLSNGQSTTVADCEEQLQDLMKYINELKTPMFMIRGNHDSNHFNTSAPFTATMYYRDTDKFCEKNNDLIMYSDELEKSIGYIDLDNLKIRLIFTNMTDVGDDPSGFGITWAQMDWFGKVALDFSDKTDKEDWGVIVFSHSYFEASSITEGGLAIAPQMHQMLLAFKEGTTYTYNVEHSYDYTSQGAMEVICAVVGHWHSDRSAVVDGIQVIATMQTAGGGDEPADDGNTYAKVWGTADETAYDVFTVDRENKKIYATRFGVGVDRNWTYQ